MQPAMNDTETLAMSEVKVVDVSVLPQRSVQLDALLRDRTRIIATHLLLMCPEVEELIQDQHYLAFGFERPEDYFQSRLGISYRSVARIMQIHKAIKQLPAGQQNDARQKLAAIGTHKAGVIAPAIASVPETWESWVTVAEMTTEEALQDAVNKALNRPPKASAGGDNTHQAILNRFPPDLRDWGEQLFHAARQVSGANSWIGALVAIFQEAEGGIMQAYELKKKGKLV